MRKLLSLLIMSLLSLSLSAFDRLPAGQLQSEDCTAARAEAGECNIEIDEEEEEDEEEQGGSFISRWWNSQQAFPSQSDALGLIFLQPYDVALLDERLTQTGDITLEMWEQQQSGQFSSYEEVLGFAQTKGNSLLAQWLAGRGEPGLSGQPLGGGPSPAPQNDGSEAAASAQEVFEGDRTGTGISVSDTSWWQIGLNWLVDQAVGAVTGWLPGDSGASSLSERKAELSVYSRHAT